MLRGIFSWQSSRRRGDGFPAPADGVQVNFCKNVSCEAFGVPETLHRVRRSKFSLPAAGDYIRGGEVDRVQMVCALCGSKNSLRSNTAIVEERRRLNQRSFDTEAQRFDQLSATRVQSSSYR